MAKLNINFNNKKYSIDESLLTSASDELRSHISTDMNGSGATINLGGIIYNVDSAKLSAATNDFVSYLGTIVGSGTRVVIGGVERGIGSDKVANAVASLENHFVSLRPADPEPLPAGLYETGAIALWQDGDRDGASAMMKTSWEDLVAQDIIAIGEGIDVPEGIQLNEYGFYYGVEYSADLGDGHTMGFTFNEDASCVITDMGQTIMECPAGAVIYGDHTIDATALGMPIFTVTGDGASIDGEGIILSIGDGDAKPKGVVYLPATSTTFTIEGDLVLIDDGSATTLGIELFSSQESLTGIIIPDSVTNIGYYIFSDCSNLTSVVIPNSIDRLPDGLFKNCTNLKNVIIPDSVTSIGYGVFDGCSNLTNIIIPNGINDIGDRAFYNCRSLKSLVIPNSVTSIGHNAIHGCSSLESFEIPDSVTRIDWATDSWQGDRMFNECTSLTSVIIGNGITEIGSYAFCDASSLETVVVGNNVTNIGEYAFSNCGSLKIINIPSSVVSVGIHAFDDSHELNVYITDIDAWCKITFDSYGANPLSYDGGLYLNDVLVTDLEIPNSVTRIGDYAFCKYNGLTNVVIPSSVTSIGDYAFDSTGLKSVDIPNSVTSIGDAAFQVCNNLTDVNIPNSVTSIGKEAFMECQRLINMNFNGTIAEWQSITFGYSWDKNMPSDYIITCTDGTIDANGNVTYN